MVAWLRRGGAIPRLATVSRQLRVRPDPVHLADPGPADRAHAEQRLEDLKVLLSRRRLHVSVLASEDHRGARGGDQHEEQGGAKVHLQLPGRHRSGECAHRPGRRPVAGREDGSAGVH